MEITGKLVEIFDTVQINDSFRKREFVVEYSDNSQYPEFIKFELFQDKAEIIDGYKVGEEIEVAFNLKGRKWNDPKGGVKYFNTLQAWRLSKKSSTPAKTDSAAPMEEPEWLSDQDDENVLPF
jgi:hypothetical protein